MKKIEPTILKGTRDFTPAEMAKRNFVMDQVRRIFEKYGYAALETPILSPAETILGKYGEEGDRLTYHWQDQGEREVALPYDLTVPFARYAAANWRDLPMPFKRYQIQRVWRAEKPQKGRLREFYQCDIDVIGTRSLLVEAEVAKIIVEVFTALGISDFKIKVNSRKSINVALINFGIEENKAAAVIRILDKLEKIGTKAVTEELEKLGINKYGELLNYLTSSTAHQDSELAQFWKYAEDLGVDTEKYLWFDPFLARGLDYYTGIIFEVVSKKADFGTLCAGGRYDNLTALFEVNASGEPDTSGMGVAFGFERIMLVLEELGALKDVALGAQLLVTQFPELGGEARKLYGELTAAGVSAEIYFEETKIDKQLKFADKKGLPYVAILGPEESKEGVVILKNMATGEQERLSRAEMIDKLSTS